MLKREIPERVWFFDMEWVPDANAARRLYGLPADTPEADAIGRLWEEAGATESRPRPFVKYLFSRIVSIAFLSRLVNGDGKTPVFSLRSYPKLPITGPLSEREVIKEFLAQIGEKKPQLVGFNSHDSDMQVLIQRGLLNGVTAPQFCSRPENKWDPHYFQQWDNEEHLDLIKLFSNKRGMTPRLDELAKLCGFPGKIDIHGDQVTELWLNGDVKTIIEYNQIDVLNTYLVWLRVVHFCGKISDQQYEEESKLFRQFLEREAAHPEKQHVGAFLEKWNAASTWEKQSQKHSP